MRLDDGRSKLKMTAAQMTHSSRPVARDFPAGLGGRPEAVETAGRRKVHGISQMPRNT